MTTDKNIEAIVAEMEAYPEDEAWDYTRELAAHLIAQARAERDQYLREAQGMTERWDKAQKERDEARALVMQYMAALTLAAEVRAEIEADRDALKSLALYR